MRAVYGIHYSHAAAVLQQRKLRRFLRAREAGAPLAERPRFAPASTPVPSWASDVVVERQGLLAWEVVLVDEQRVAESSPAGR